MPALFLKWLIKDKIALTGSLLLLAIVTVAILAPYVSPYPPNEQHVLHTLENPSSTYLLGTDQYGRDLLSRILWAARPSLIVGLVSVSSAMVGGMLLGMLAGYFGGLTDHLVMRTVDITLSFPSLVLGLMIAVVLGGGLINTIIAISITFVPRFARLARGSTVSIKENYYVEAGRALGSNSFEIFTRHLLPNIIGPDLVVATLWVGQAIRLEAGLSFLGMGVQPPTPSWGNMLKAGVDNILRASHLALYPGLCIVVAVLAFNLLGDSLRDQIDPTLRRS
ncbi:MAG: ABC transporter permease [Candidatus Bipolaricaulota bacterium]